MSRPRLCDCGDCRRCRKREAMVRFRSRNPGYNDQYLRRGQAIIEAAKAVPCDDCGVEHPHYVMDFDHREPEHKLFAIGHLSRATNADKLLAEIAKCDVVCANCHRARTYVQQRSFAYMDATA